MTFIRMAWDRVSCSCMLASVRLVSSHRRLCLSFYFPSYLSCCGVFFYFLGVAPRNRFWSWTVALAGFVFWCIVGFLVLWLCRDTIDLPK